MNTIENMEEPTDGLEINDEARADVKPIAPPPPQSPPASAPLRRQLWKIPAKITLLGGVVALVYWQRAFLQNASPYIPVVVPTAIALGQIRFKDWGNYKHKVVRWALVCFILAGGAWGIVYQSQQIKDRAAQKARADAGKEDHHIEIAARLE